MSKLASNGVGVAIEDRNWLVQNDTIVLWTNILWSNPVWRYCSWIHWFIFTLPLQNLSNWSWHFIWTWRLSWWKNAIYEFIPQWKLSLFDPQSSKSRIRRSGSKFDPKFGQLWASSFTFKPSTYGTKSYWTVNIEQIISSSHQGLKRAVYISPDFPLNDNIYGIHPILDEIIDLKNE